MPNSNEPVLPEEVPNEHPAAVPVLEVPIVPEVPVAPVTPETVPEIPAAESGLDSTGFKFNGADVTVEVPADLREELAGKGVDVNAVVKELYTSEDFNLTPETKDKLYAVYGKAMVESYLQGLRLQNEVTMKSHTDGIAAATAADELAWTETAAQVGGEEAWNALELWAQGTFTDEEFKDFNAAMTSGSRYTQKLAVADLMARHKAVDGDAAPDLITGERVAPVTTSGALSAAEYRKGFQDGSYAKSPAEWDARRRKGHELGI